MTSQAPLNHATNQPPERCPKCEALNLDGMEVCSSCGIIFRKYFEVQARIPKDLGKKRPRLYASPGLRELEQYAQFFRRLGKLLAAGGSLSQSLKGASGSGSPGLLIQKAGPFLNQGHGLIQSLEMSGAKMPAYVWAHLEAGDASGRLPEF